MAPDGATCYLQPGKTTCAAGLIPFKSITWSAGCFPAPGCSASPAPSRPPGAGTALAPLAGDDLEIQYRHALEALATDPGARDDVILTPPFGKKSSSRVIGEDDEVDAEREDYAREDFKFTTGNKQLMQQAAQLHAARRGSTTCAPTGTSR